jgi:hypothetical protein
VRPRSLYDVARDVEGTAINAAAEPARNHTRADAQALAKNVL